MDDAKTSGPQGAWRYRITGEWELLHVIMSAPNPLLPHADFEGDGDG